MRFMANLNKLKILAALFSVALLFILTAAPVTATSINSGAGTTGFAFLKQGVGARAVALGGAYVSLADDPSVIYYNPGGTVHLQGRQFLAGYHNYILDVQSGFLAMTLPLQELGTLGLFISYMNYGEFTRTDLLGNIDESDPTFSGGDFLIGLNYSRNLMANLSGGLNLKFMTEYADGYSSQAMAVDLGLLYKFSDLRTQAGLSIYNLGGVLSGFSANSAEENKDKLPLGGRIGISHTLRGLPILVALNGVLPNDNNPYVNVGLEYFKIKPLYFRFGYSTFGLNYKTGSDTDGLGGTSFGFGIDYQKFQISYAFMPYLDLGSSHRMTIVGEF